MNRLLLVAGVLILPSICCATNANQTFASVVLSLATCGLGATFAQQGAAAIDSGPQDTGPSTCENLIGQRATGQGSADPGSLNVQAHAETSSVSAGAVGVESFALVTLIPPDPCFTGSVDVVAGSTYSLLLASAGAGLSASVSFSVTAIDGVAPPTTIGDSKQITSSGALAGQLSAPFTIQACPCSFVLDVRGLVGVNLGASGAMQGSLFLQLPPGWSFSTTALPAVGPSITSVSPNPVIGAVGAQNLFVNGSGFQSGATVHVANSNFQSDLSGGQVTFFSCSQLSIRLDVGAVAASWTATVNNPGAQGSNVFAFNVVAPGPTSFALPQFTFGGAWYTALYFTNTTEAVVQIPVHFYDDTGAPLLVPLLGIGSVSSQNVSLNPHSTAILEAPISGGIDQQGWADVSLPTGVTGYGVFRQTVAGRADQEAVVPLTPESSQTADLTYDDTNFTTAVAFLNPTTQTVTVTVQCFDATGAPLGSSQLILPTRSKFAATLRNLPGLSGISGLRGRAVFSVPSGAVSVLGLRFGGAAFTSIPVAHRPAMPVTEAISFALPQFVFGNPWYTALYFSNTTNAMTSFPLGFFGDDSFPLPVQLTGIGTVASQTVTLGPGATAILEAPLTDSPGEGWAHAFLPPGVTGYAVFRQTVAGRLDQEAVVPLTPESAQTADMIYDDIVSTTAIAFLNPSNQRTTVTITVYSVNGGQIGTTQVALVPHAKVANILRNLPGLSAMNGNRGWASFSVPNGAVSVLGLRFGGSAFTSIPVAHR